MLFLLNHQLRSFAGRRKTLAFLSWSHGGRREESLQREMERMATFPSVRTGRRWRVACYPRHEASLWKFVAAMPEEHTVQRSDGRNETFGAKGLLGNGTTRAFQLSYNGGDIITATRCHDRCQGPPNVEARKIRTLADTFQRLSTKLRAVASLADSVSADISKHAATP